MRKADVLIIGSGMGGLTAGALLARKGLKVTILDQNWQPGGCTSAYWRKGFVFEAGATTLVGLGENMPLQHVLDLTGIELKPRRLQLPMQVHLGNDLISRYEPIEAWISEAERVFGKRGQRAFWEEAYRISQFVWKTSLRQTHFPPGKFSDLGKLIANSSIEQLKFARYAFISTDKLLKKHGLDSHKQFVDFVNEQLLITAQNHMEEVNALFGSTALCYTNYPNYYLDGGLLSLVRPFVEYIESHGGEVRLREGVKHVESNESGYRVHSTKEEYQAGFVISGIPVNDTLELFAATDVPRIRTKVMESEQLNSAFQMGIGFKPHKGFSTLHHQIHLEEPLPETGSASIFVSLSHPDDHSRTDESGQAVMSVSTHIPDPANCIVENERVEEAIVEVLVKRDFIKKGNIIYQHSSTPKSWAKWTGRKWGFVGGYPQYKSIKPWQMLDARFDGHKAYMVGDTVYPGQGIPGVTLSGIIAVEKMSNDWGL